MPLDDRTDTGEDAVEIGRDLGSAAPFRKTRIAGKVHEQQPSPSRSEAAAQSLPISISWPTSVRGT